MVSPTSLVAKNQTVADQPEDIMTTPDMPDIGIMNQQPLTPAFRALLIRTWLKGDSPPETLSVALSGAEVPDDGDGIGLEDLEAEEVEALGYKRGVLIAANWQEHSDDAGAAFFIEAGFLNTSEDVVWESVRTMFITTSPLKGSVLVAVAPIPFSPKRLAPGDSISGPFFLRF